MQNEDWPSRGRALIKGKIQAKGCRTLLRSSLFCGYDHVLQPHAEPAPAGKSFGEKPLCLERSFTEVSGPRAAGRGGGEGCHRIALSGKGLMP